MALLSFVEPRKYFNMTVLTAQSSPARLLLLTVVLWISLAGVASALTLGNSMPLVFDDGNGNTLLYRLFLPPGHDEPGAEFPLVLFMHGSNQRGTNNTSQLQIIDGLVRATQSERFASFLLAPQVQPEQGSWNSLTRGLTRQVMQQIEQQYSVDTERRYVTGLSMAGLAPGTLLPIIPTCSRPLCRCRPGAIRVGQISFSTQGFGHFMDAKTVFQRNTTEK